jgi:hypothetical protein
MKAQWVELAAMVLIGDGVLNLVHPRRHSALWNCGPESYRRIAGKLQTRPQVARGLGLAMVALGVWLGNCAAKQV